MEAKRTTSSLYENVALARQIIRDEALSLQRLSTRLPADFSQAVITLVECQGAALVTGIGKAGWIGQKLSATLASTGTRSHFVHPGEAMHGDLGRVGPDDVLIVLSNSGETEEILRMLPSAESLSASVIAITATTTNSLAQRATLVLDYGQTHEACPNGLAPTTTTTTMLALGDALALVTAQAQGFGPLDFARYHPGGSLGKQLATVDDLMRPIDQCRVALDQSTVRETFVETAGPSRRSGAILLVDEQGALSGLFTDSDLARLLENKDDQALDHNMQDVMTREPLTVRSGARLSEAVDVLAARNISELPVIDERNRPLGMLDITDLIGLMPSEDLETE